MMMQSLPQQKKASSVPIEQMAAYAGCFLVAGVTYHFVSDREFSSILTMANYFQCLSFVLILLQIRSSGSVAGISGRTMMMQALSLAFRLSSTCVLDGYLPLDKSGDHIYQITDVLSLLMCLKALHCIYRTHLTTYDQEYDTMDVKNMLIGCAALAVVVHPPLNDWATFDIAWAMALYIDTVSMLPQLLLCSKSRRVPAYTAHFLMATLVSRFFSATFWYYGAESVARMQEGFSWSAAAIVLAHVLQFVVLLYFAYHYARAISNGALCKHSSVQLPRFDGSVHEI